MPIDGNADWTSTMRESPLKVWRLNRQWPLANRQCGPLLGLRDAMERCDDRGVELEAGAAVQLEERLGRRDGVAEDARARHRVERVGDGDDPRADRYLRRVDAARIAETVHPLLRAAHQIGGRREVRNRANEVGADRRVPANQELLLFGQRRRLAEDRL